MIITKEEVKKLIGSSDKYSEKESITISSNEYHRLTYKPVLLIHRVDTDTEWSTASAYTTGDYYTTQDYQNYTLIRRIDTGTITTGETFYVTYSYNRYDTRINDLIPIVQNDLVDYLNNYFPDENTKYESPNIRFLSSGPYIYDTADMRFELEGFTTGMDITVEGTDRNKGIYLITALTSAIMTLSTNDTLVAERSSDDYGGNFIRITRIKWPPGIKRTVAKIIWLNIDRDKSNNIKSKSLGPSAITYQDLESGGYSQDIYNELKKYKNAYLK